MAELLKGAPVAAAITEELAARAQALRESGTVPTLALLRIGQRAEDLAYERGARSRCAKVGIEIREFFLSEDYRREELVEAIRTINGDPTIHGCLMFRPLASREDERMACDLLAPEKDMDCMTDRSLAALVAGREGYPPCTAQACIELLDYYGISLRGKRVTVVGRSMVIGKPVSLLAQSRDATVTVCHRKTVDVAAECRRADIVIAAAGEAGLLGAEHLREGQIVLDVGMNVGADGALCGDVQFGAAEAIVSAITPVPGGIGNVTTSVLAKHVILAAEKAAAEK